MDPTTRRRFTSRLFVLALTVLGSAPRDVLAITPALASSGGDRDIRGGSLANTSLTKVDAPDPVTSGTDLTYTIVASNEGPDPALSAVVNDVLPAGTTFVSMSPPSGWTCMTPAVGAGGTVNCTNPSLAVGSDTFVLTVHVDPTLAPLTVLTNTADLTSTTPDQQPDDNIATALTTVLSPARLTATKTVASGTPYPGSAVTYTVVIRNSGPAMQHGNPGPELTDVLPPQLALVSAMATSGTAVATIGTNTVTWDGSLAVNATVTITIQATIGLGVAPGTTVTNQGTLAYDLDGDGANEASGLTDDPAPPGATDPTAFVVVGQPVVQVPALGGAGLAALAGLLAVFAASRLRRSGAGQVAR